MARIVPIETGYDDGTLSALAESTQPAIREQRDKVLAILLLGALALALTGARWIMPRDAWAGGR